MKVSSLTLRQRQSEGIATFTFELHKSSALCWLRIVRKYQLQETVMDLKLPLFDAVLEWLTRELWEPERKTQDNVSTQKRNLPSDLSSGNTGEYRTTKS